jgi:hypothetical protein
MGANQSLSARVPNVRFPHEAVFQADPLAPARLPPREPVAIVSETPLASAAPRPQMRASQPTPEPAATMTAPIQRAGTRLSVLFPALLLLSACGQTGLFPWEAAVTRREQVTARVLNQRLQIRLAGDIAAGRAAVAPVPGGMAVSSPDEGSVRSSLVEALLDPALMQVAVSDTTNLPETQKQIRIASLRDYFGAFGLGPTLLPNDSPDAVPPVAGTPPGLTVRIAVQCPDRDYSIGYGTGQKRAGCY